MEIKILIHWDADGICSGVILRDYLERKGFKVKKFIVPPIGTFEVDEKVLNEISKETVLFVVDVNFSKKVFEKLKKKGCFVINFDHHIKKENIDVLDFRKNLPSTTSVLEEFLNLDENFLVKAGIYGDSPTLKGKIKEFSNLIDTGYKLNSRKMVERIANFLWKNRKKPEKVFSEKFLLDAKIKLKKEAERIKKIKPKIIEGIFVKEFSSKYNLISEIGRFYASLRKYNVVLLINKGYIKNKWQFYLRSSKRNIDMKKIIDFTRKKGYNCGGKKEVMGAIVPENKGEKFKKELIEIV